MSAVSEAVERGAPGLAKSIFGLIKDVATGSIGGAVANRGMVTGAFYGALTGAGVGAVFGGEKYIDPYTGEVKRRFSAWGAAMGATAGAVMGAGIGRYGTRAFQRGTKGAWRTMMSDAARIRRGTMEYMAERAAKREAARAATASRRATGASQMEFNFEAAAAAPKGASVGSNTAEAAAKARTQAEAAPKGATMGSNKPGASARAQAQANAAPKGAAMKSNQPIRPTQLGFDFGPPVSRPARAGGSATASSSARASAAARKGVGNQYELPFTSGAMARNRIRSPGYQPPIMPTGAVTTATRRPSRLQTAANMVNTGTAALVGGAAIGATYAAYYGNPFK